MAVAVLDRPVVGQIEYGLEYITPEVCVAIWRAVLEENIDCFLGHGYQLSKKDRRAAPSWFYSTDFDEVCEMAGFDPERARASVLELSEKGFCSLKEASDAA
ncbi:MAG: hypothetical protein ACSHX3_15835 [Litorimonas sp.]